MQVAETEVWGELRSRLRSFVAGRVADQTVHEDLVQEIFLRLHRGLPRMRDTDRLDAFAYQIARNAIIDHYRRPERERLAAPATFDERAADEGDESGEGRGELARCLRPVIDQLDEPYREALLLTDLGDLSQAQAARHLSLSEPGMRSRVQRGRAHVQEALEACCAVKLDAADQIGDVERHGPCACPD